MTIAIDMLTAAAMIAWVVIGTFGFIAWYADRYEVRMRVAATAVR